MTAKDEEEERLRSVALQNAQSVLRARRRAEEELRRQTEWFRVTLASIGDAVIATDCDGRVTFMNSVAESLTGWTQAEALGQLLPDVFRIVNDETGAAVQDPAARALREGAVIGLGNHTLLVAKDGTERPIDDSAAPIRSRDGALLGCILVFRDVSARRHADAEREALVRSERAARTAAERANRLKEDFLATLSHELRTPLNTMLGWIQILRKKPSPENLEQGLAVLDRNARIQAQLIADLLDMSSILSGKTRLDIQPVELPVVVEAALAAVRPAAENKGVGIRSVIEPIPGRLLADAARLQQVIWNLLSNAVKFTPHGGRIHVALSRVSSHVEISVSDTGCGIDPEFLPHVFERFSQADSSITRAHRGLGLGLAIVKQLVELHGGTVEARSRKGHGAAFTVRLPMTAVQESGRTTDERHQTAPSLPTAYADAPDLAGLRVLVLDDEADARRLIEHVLTECGAEVVLVSTAREGLSALAAEQVDVILSDIGLPERDGYAFIADVRDRGIRTPAAALTAFARSEDRTRALGSGYQTHIAKPVEPAELLAAVAALAHGTGRGPSKGSGADGG